MRDSAPPDSAAHPRPRGIGRLMDRRAGATRRSRFALPCAGPPRPAIIRGAHDRCGPDGRGGGALSFSARRLIWPRTESATGEASPSVSAGTMEPARRYSAIAPRFSPFLDSAILMTPAGNAPGAIARIYAGIVRAARPADSPRPLGGRAKLRGARGRWDRGAGGGHRRNRRPGRRDF